MAILSAHSVQVWLTACEARDRARECAKNDPDAWTSDAIVAIVLSAASTEAFINELAELVEMTKIRLDETLSSELRAFADAIRGIEESRGSLQDKYLMAAQTLRGSPFDKGTNPWQDFAILVTLRNDIMHLRPKGKTEIAPDGRQWLAPPKYIADLQQRGLARTPNPKVSMSWFDSIQTTEMASWAPETAHEIILAVLDLIPDDPIAGRDPTLFFKTPFRNRKDIIANGEHLITRDARQESFLKWASHSLLGHVVLVQIGITIPMLFAFWDSMYSGGVLTFGRVLYLLSLIVGSGLIVAVLFWYTVSRPLIRRSKKKT